MQVGLTQHIHTSLWRRIKEEEESDDHTSNEQYINDDVLFHWNKTLEQ